MKEHFKAASYIKHGGQLFQRGVVKAFERAMACFDVVAVRAYGRAPIVWNSDIVVWNSTRKP